MNNFTNTLNALNSLKTETIKISQTKTGEAIHQTQRNKISNILRSALLSDLSAVFPISENSDDIVVYDTADGIVLEVPNETVRDNITNADGSGAISIEIGFKVKNLEFNAKDSSEAYAQTCAQKAEKKAEAEAKKKKNIEKDKKSRESKKSK